MTARERVEAAAQKAAMEVAGLDRLEQLANFVDGGFGALAEEFDRLATRIDHSEADFMDAIAAIREMVTLLDGPVSEPVQKAQDIGKEALKRLVGDS